MQTYLDCIPCFFRQALESTKMLKAGPAQQKKVLDQLARLIPDFSLTLSPPQMGMMIHDIIKDNIASQDPYYQVKLESNKKALELYPKIEEQLSGSIDRILSAVILAIAGNIIDYGVKNILSLEQELQNILSSENRKVNELNKSLFNYQDFKQAINSAGTILYIGDNAGEIVFDRILMEEIKRLDTRKKIIYAVREKPVINDVVMEDAIFCGMDQYAEIISSGCPAPGTIPALCSPEFLKLFQQADLVISKGQGNFEALSLEHRSIYFLFMVKCSIVAEHIQANIGEMVLYHQQLE